MEVSDELHAPACLSMLERFNLKKLNEGEVKEQYQVAIQNRFSALENFEDNN
jgi:hypothetical protein